MQAEVDDEWLSGYRGQVTDQRALTPPEAAEAFRAIATMLEELIPLLDCGCNACLRSAGDNFVQLGEELHWLVEHIRPEDVTEHHGRRPAESAPIRNLSAAALRRLSGSLRMRAAALDRVG